MMSLQHIQNLNEGTPLYVKSHTFHDYDSMSCDTCAS